MGGSGGGFFSGRVSPDELARQTRKAEEQTRDNAFESSVSAFLASELARCNDHDAEGTQAVFRSIKKELEAEGDGTVDLLYGGSVAKHTYVDGLSDVDALVLMDRHELKDKQPMELQRLLAELLGAHYGRDAVLVGKLAVTLTYEGKTLQFLPSLRDGDKYKIASSDGQSWALIDPTGFAKALTKANKVMDGKLVPCIKIAKSIMISLPEQRRLTGYHVESLAIKIFRSYEGPKTTKDMVSYFFEQAPEHVKHPIRDSSGQSVHVDEYLGETNSLERRTVADALGRIARRIRNADGAQSLERWKELLQ